MKWLVGALFALALSAASYARASATSCSVPNSLVNGNYVDANGLNSNFAALVACGNAIDNTNIGINGIFASQIKPLTVGEATFGGSEPYKFVTALTTAGITDTNATGSTFDGLVVGKAGNQINAPGSSGLYLNYASGTSGVIIGNGASAITGTQFSSDGDTAIGRNLIVNSGTITDSGGISDSGGVTSSVFGTFNGLLVGVGTNQVDVPSTGTLYLNYGSGSGGVVIGNGASGSSGTKLYASGNVTVGNTLTVDGGTATVGGINDTGGIVSTTYGQFDGMNVGLTGNQVNVAGSGGLYLNYATGTGGVYVGNGAGGTSGTRFLANGSATFGGTITIGSSTFSATGLSINGNIISQNGTFASPASMNVQLCPNNSCTNGFTVYTSGALSGTSGYIPQVTGGGAATVHTEIHTCSASAQSCTITFTSAFSSSVSYACAVDSSTVTVPITTGASNGSTTGVTISSSVSGAQTLSAVCTGT